mmetsp:Transcript_45598/g.74319  ORF Transcript_45598/g.74319 Transcript_45598/m.74319 type:complete len:603 (+) Transcript_45598:245-2053(+)
MSIDNPRQSRQRDSRKAPSPIPTDAYGRAASGAFPADPALLVGDHMTTGDVSHPIQPVQPSHPSYHHHHAQYSSQNSVSGGGNGQRSPNHPQYVSQRRASPSQSQYGGGGGSGQRSPSYSQYASGPSVGTPRSSPSPYVGVVGHQSPPYAPYSYQPHPAGHVSPSFPQYVAAASGHQSPHYANYVSVPGPMIVAGVPVPMLPASPIPGSPGMGQPLSMGPPVPPSPHALAQRRSSFEQASSEYDTSGPPPTRRRNSVKEDDTRRALAQMEARGHSSSTSPDPEDWTEEDLINGKIDRIAAHSTWRKKLWSRLFPQKRHHRKKESPRDRGGLESRMPPRSIEPETVPIVFVWSEYVASRNVSVTGTFCEPQWGQFIPMVYEDNEFYTVLNLKPGPYQYKFLVDGHWRFSKDHETRTDERGIINNHIDVKPMPRDETSIFAVPGGDDDGSEGWTTLIPPVHRDSAQGDNYSYRGRPESPPPLPPYFKDEYAPLNLFQAITPGTASSSGPGCPPDGVMSDPSKLPSAPMNVQLDHLFSATSTSAEGGGMAVFSVSQRYRTKCTTLVFFASTPPPPLLNNPTSSLLSPDLQVSPKAPPNKQTILPA